MLLIDTNIFIEILLKQESSLKCEKFLAQLEFKELHISHFALNSIGVIMNKLKKLDELEIFLQNFISEITVLTLNDKDLTQMITIMKQFNLDYDDAYQYFTAKKYKLKLVSLDKDFDKTDIERIQP